MTLAGRDSMAHQNDTAPPLPQNIEAERAVLGAILLDNSVLEKLVCDGLKSGDFFHDHHRQLFNAMLAMYGQKKAIDTLTLCDHLGKERKLTLTGGLPYIEQLQDGRPRVSNISFHATIVKEKSRLRAMIHQAAAIERAANEPSADPNDIEKLLQINSSALQTANGNGNGNGHPKLKSYFLDEFLAEKFPIPEHLVEGVIPRGGTVLIVALPHRLKSWFTTSLAMACTRAGEALGKLNVIRPVRTLLMQMEDFPGELQYRIGQLALSNQFLGCDPKALKIVPRCQFNLPDEEWYQELLREVTELNADVVVLDVVRRIFRGDINSPKDTAAFLEAVDRLRDATGCAVVLVHHENKKGEELMTASAGSYTLPSWANVMIKFSRKVEEKTAVGNITRVELEIDNKLAASPEPMRMVLDFSQSEPVRMELLEDGTGFNDAMERLGGDWTVRDLAEALDVHKSNAQRRLTKWLKMGNVEKIAGGKHGPRGGLARYRATNNLNTDS
jgi:KaiC/GvpD/RAD55 family RecA-like ATPase